ncbi:MAG: DUF1850 domain-containing protein [Treponema sp.]|nr:DUF1850 domain-containing protein [Treponema sp.]
MKPRWWYGIVLNLLIAVLGVSLAAIYVIHSRKEKSRTLEIRDAVSGRVYGKWPLKEGEEFAVEFTHSVHQSPVREIYIIEGNMILPWAVRFYSFGAGMKSDLEEGQTLSKDGDALLITGFCTGTKEFNYIVSDHILLINAQEINLREFCGKNKAVTIRYYGEKI